jgi:hypothetical protein
VSDGGQVGIRQPLAKHFEMGRAGGMAIKDSLIPPGVVRGLRMAAMIDENEAAHLAAGEQTIAVGRGRQQFED